MHPLTIKYSSLAHPDSYREVRAKTGKFLKNVDSIYIIYSKKLDKYYVGESNNIDSRLVQHNTGFFSNSFTSQVDDWEIFLTIPCDSRSQSRKIESHIKRMKSREYIENIKKYPEIISKLKEKYK